MNRRDFLWLSTLLTLSGCKQRKDTEKKTEQKTQPIVTDTPKVYNFPNQIYSNGKLANKTKSIESLNLVFNDTFDISKEESIENIKNNVVRLNFKSHETDTDIHYRTGTGLKITSDGWILTAYHCIRRFEKGWIKKAKELADGTYNIWQEPYGRTMFIQDNTNAWTNTGYAVDVSAWATNPKYDIALIKADIDENPSPVRFKRLDRELSQGDAIQLLNIGDGFSIDYNPGVVDKTRIRYKTTESGLKYDCFTATTHSMSGYSGGPAITHNGEYAGLIHSSPEGWIPSSTFAKAKNIVNLVNETVEVLSGRKSVN